MRLFKPLISSLDRSDPIGRILIIETSRRKAANPHVIVLAPMPLEMDAIVTAFGLDRQNAADGAPWTGKVGNSHVIAMHIGMGPRLTREALSRLLDKSPPGDPPVDHVMIVGICGGLDPDLEVGTVINPAILVEESTGGTYRHNPPAGPKPSGKLLTTEGVTLDRELSERFFDDGFIAVDMESAAVAEFCDARGYPWSVYRCIGDRYIDGLLDERVIALTNPDGSGNEAEIMRLIATEPELLPKLERLAHDSALAARLAAEAAVRGCLALSG